MENSYEQEAIRIKKEMRRVRSRLKRHDIKQEDKISLRAKLKELKGLLKKLETRQSES